MVAEDLPAATQAVLTGNSEALQLLAERDRVIDGLYAEIEELVNREILLYWHWSPPTCASCCRCCGSCPNSNVPTTSS